MITTSIVALSAFASVASAAMWNVTVGAGGQLRYDPQNISGVAVGDTVRFTFNPKNHTVTQSAFSPPCIPLAGGGGFNSGFHPVAAGTANASLPFVDYSVQVDTPLWFFCEQTGHCGEGMVFSINAPATGNTFAAFQADSIAQNGTSSSSTTAAASSSSSAVYSVPPPSIVTVTATVTVPSSTYLTTYGSWPGSSAPTPAADPQNHVIQVGAGGELAYSPSNITASIGDTVTFVFNPKNHTVTQSTFEEPCVKAVGGFDSGFNFAVASGTAPNNFSFTVNGTAPVWVYCRQTGHCGDGMVFAVNAVADSPNNFTAFQMLAKTINGTTTSATSSGTGSTTSSTGSSAAMGAASLNLGAVSMAAGSLLIAVVSGFFL